jgi:hypothetical protein
MGADVMELFCALLTGFFLWLFLFHWHRTSLARAHEMAGAFLLGVRPAGDVVPAVIIESQPYGKLV